MGGFKGMKQRKSVMIVLSLFLVLTLLLQACSSSTPNTEVAPEKVGNEANQGAAGNDQVIDKVDDASKLEPYEVIITYNGKPQKDDALVEAKLNEFFKEKINATVKLQPIASSDYKTRTELMMNTGEKMDLVFTASWLNYFGNVTKGGYLELDELLDKYGQGIKERINPLYLEAPRLKGKLYAVPTNKEITQGKAYIYRKDIVDKYNIPIETIKNDADLEPWFKLLKQEEPDIISKPIAGGSGNFGGGYMMYEANSNYRSIGPIVAKQPMWLVDYKSPTMEVKTVLDPEIVELNKRELELYRHYYKEGYINPDAATSKASIVDLRREGKVWVQAATWKPGAEIEMQNTDNNKYEYVSQIIEEPIVTTDLATGSMMSISRTSKDPERAMMVLNYLHTDPYVINLIVYGIEGVHFNKVGDNRIEQIAEAGYGQETQLFWVIGNQMLNHLLPGQPDDLYINWEKFNNDATRFPLMGFVFDDTNVKNEISQMTTVVKEFSSIFSGAVDNPTKLLEERNEQLKAAGIEKVQAEIQTQIDTWWTENK
jgi:putative aldouronate transport system substrate-binding protein